MWDTILPKSNCSWEPVELRILKQELANMTCKCRACESFRNPSVQIRGHAQCNDEAIQVNQKDKLLNKYIYANSDVSAGAEEFQPNSLTYLRKDAFCSNCYFFWDLLQRVTKVFKDEESEIKPDSTDKSTEKCVRFADSSTSVSSVADEPAAFKDVSSNLSISDSTTDSLSTALSEAKSNHHVRVTFLEDFPHIDARKIKPTITNSIHGNCFCLENFMDAIRPPLNDIL